MKLLLLLLLLFGALFASDFMIMTPKILAFLLGIGVVLGLFNLLRK